MKLKEIIMFLFFGFLLIFFLTNTFEVTGQAITQTDFKEYNRCEWFEEDGFNQKIVTCPQEKPRVRTGGCISPSDPWMMSIRNHHAILDYYVNPATNRTQDAWKCEIVTSENLTITTQALCCR